MRGTFAGLSLLLLSLVGCAAEDVADPPVSSENAAVVDDHGCGPTQKYCDVTDECIARTARCEELHCPSGYHLCFDYCERNGALCK